MTDFREWCLKTGKEASELIKANTVELMMMTSSFAQMGLLCTPHGTLLALAFSHRANGEVRSDVIDALGELPDTLEQLTKDVDKQLKQLRTYYTTRI